jgi:hypothetical protein
MDQQHTAVDPGAKEAARAHAQAVVSNDIGASVLGMTPDALAKAMQLGNTTWVYLGFDVAPAGRDGEDCLFDITYQTDEGPFTLRDRFRRIDGDWKVVDIERIA